MLISPARVLLLGAVLICVATMGFMLPNQRDPAAMTSASESSARRITLLLVGDIHGQWDDADLDAVRSLAPDAVLFVGDFGNEDTKVVRSVAELARELPVAAVLGNHDAWHTTLGLAPDGVQLPRFDRDRADGRGLRAQLECLGQVHVGFGRRDCQELGLSVVGGRPCTWGGGDWLQLAGAPAALYERFFDGLSSFEESTQRICAAAAAAPTAHGLVFLAHNGPSGLGSARDDPVGKDFGGTGGGDHGDPDLTAAVETTLNSGRHIPLVAFGHMHDVIDGVAGARKAVASEASSNGGVTVYVNAAVVPRRRKGPDGFHRCFTVVTMTPTAVERVLRLWLNSRHEPVEELQLFPERSSSL